MGKGGECLEQNIDHNLKTKASSFPSRNATLPVAFADNLSLQFILSFFLKNRSDISDPSAQVTDSSKSSFDK